MDRPLLRDSGGNNTLLGGDGDDTIEATSPGINVIDGGAGIDRLWLNASNLTQSVTVNLNQGTGVLADGTTLFAGIELLDLTTGSGDDTVTFRPITSPATQ